MRLAGGIYGRQHRQPPETGVGVAGHRAGLVEPKDQGPTWRAKPGFPAREDRAAPLKHPLATVDKRVVSTNGAVAQQTSEPAGDVDRERALTLDLVLSEAEALRTWLLKPAKDGTTSLDDPLVSRALAKLGTAIDTVLTTVNVRHELKQAGLAVEHLTDEQVSDLGRRVAQAATPGIHT